MSNLDMSDAVRLLAEHHGISIDALLQVLVEALATAYKKRPNAADEVIVEVNPENLDMKFTAYDVDEDGNWINERDDTPNKHELGRIAAATFKQVMSQRIREVERDRKFEEYANREGDLVTGIIQQSDGRYALLDLGKVEALLPQAEQVPYERPETGARLKAYIVEVRKTAKGPQIVVSRTHPGLIKRLFELEVPEIADGVVEIKSCAREPGHRTKIAVLSNDPNVDPVGACVGARGGRVRMVVNELRGEKIDIVSYSEDLHDFVSKALSPAKVTEVRLSEDSTQADVIVPDFQLSLAIGKEGQNARLAARLTGVRIDIKSETQADVIVPDFQLSLAIGKEGQNARLAARLTGVRIDIKSETQAVNESNGIFEPRQSPRKTEYAEGEWRKDDETGEMQFHNTDGSVVSEQEWAGNTPAAAESTEA
jgi:N utilization substance protein A